MVGWHHQLNGHEFEKTLGDSEGHGSLACHYLLTLGIRKLRTGEKKWLSEHYVESQWQEREV